MMELSKQFKYAFRHGAIARYSTFLGVLAINLVFGIMALLSSIISLTGCVSVNWGGAQGGGLTGSGEIVPVTFPAGEFSQLSVNLHARINLHDSDEIKVELYENWVEHIVVENIEGYVTIRSERILRTGLDSEKSRRFIFRLTRLNRSRRSALQESSNSVKHAPLRLSCSCCGCRG